MLGLGEVRPLEDLGRCAIFDETTEVHEGGEVADAHRLLHVVGDDHDGVALADFVDEFFDTQGGDGIESRARFIEEEHLGIGHDRTSDAETLLLSAAEPQGAGVEAIFDFIPDGCAAEGSLASLFKNAASTFAVDAEGVDHILEDGHRKGVRLLEHHTQAFAQVDDIDMSVVNRAPVEQHVALDAYAVDQIVEPVDGSKEGAFAAAGGADDRGDLSPGYVHGDGKEGLRWAIEEAEIVKSEDGIKAREACVNSRSESFARADGVEDERFDGLGRARGIVAKQRSPEAGWFWSRGLHACSPGG